MVGTLFQKLMAQVKTSFFLKKKDLILIYKIRILTIKRQTPPHKSISILLLLFFMNNFFILSFNIKYIFY